MNRLPATRSLGEILPKGTEGGKEFARIVDLLLFSRAQRSGETLTLFDDSSGDYAGTDSFLRSTRRSGTTGFQYKFFRSPLSPKHRNEIEHSLRNAAQRSIKLGLTRWILVTPEDLTNSARRSDGGDIAWLESLRIKYQNKFKLEHWGHKALQSLFLETPTLCLTYYPELQPNGKTKRKSIDKIREQYLKNFDIKYRKIQFVGMSVYKAEATKGVALEHIYIPLRTLPEDAFSEATRIPKTNPLSLLAPRERTVILGDPGSGKSTLLRFLALAGQTKSLQTRFRAKADPNRLPILIPLRQYADELKTRPHLSLIDHIAESVQGDFSLKSADLDFFEHYLESGNAILCFDGLDELPTPQFKQTIRDRITGLLATYPWNTCLVTSRIVGYDANIRFDDTFKHRKVAQLSLDEIERFIFDWYVVRSENKSEREQNVNHLCEVIRHPDHGAIRELARNPLLLTIIALVHRIDAVLPDERVVLYQKCTETLLNTWHTWKHRGSDDSHNRTKTERRNRARIETLAHWMHERSLDTKSGQRAVVPYEDAHRFLAEHIRTKERSLQYEGDPEDLADSFLQFIKERAGLLIEVGDRQYSFIHLTFQEYLTSAHVATIAEHGGSEALWQHIQQKTSSPRWEETLRLLIASLKSGESRSFIIDQLTRQCETDASPIRTSLLLGCLVDAIDAAELLAEKIISRSILAAIRCTTSEDLSRLVARLRASLAKSDILKTITQSTLYKLLPETSAQEQRNVILLSAAIIGTPPEELISHWNLPQSKQDFWARRFLSPEHANEQVAEYIQPELRVLRQEAYGWAMSSPAANTAAVYSTIAAMTADPDIALKYLNRLFFSVFSSLLPHMPGPFQDFGLNIWIIRPVGFFDFLTKGQQDHIATVQPGLENFSKHGTRHARWRSALEETTNLAPQWSHRDALARHLDGTGISGYGIRTEVTQSRKNSQVSIWEFLWRIGEFRTSISQLLISTLGLTPEPHWQKALNSQIPAQIARDLATGYAACAQERDREEAMLFLVLTSIWFTCFGGEPSTKIIEESRSSSSPVLRFLVSTYDHMAGASANALAEVTHLARTAEVNAFMLDCFWKPFDPNEAPF